MTIAAAPLRSAAGWIALACAFALASPPAAADTEELATLASDPEVQIAQRAVERKDWVEAATHFERAALRDPANADLQNLLGFSYRKQGQLERAFRHYERALAIDPRHRGAHEYIGEAYLIAGDVKHAEEHLARLRELCPLSCEPLEDLERAVAEYRRTPVGAR